MPGVLQRLFSRPKPIIAMAHLPALPGTPRYDRSMSIDAIIEQVGRDVEHLLDAGVDTVMFCNEDDRPYELNASKESVAVMTRIVSELRPTDRPFGVDFLWDPLAAMSIAAATGASFMREVITGVYESDMGIWAPDAAALYRLRSRLNADDVAIFANITPEFASPLGSRTIAQRATSAAVSLPVDALLIAGPMAGAEPDQMAIEEAKGAVDVPVLLNTGAKRENIAKFLQVADGVIVGSSLKQEGYTWNPVDPDRAQAFVDEVERVRQRVTS